MKQKLTIIKIGGNVIDNTVTLSTFLKKFASINGPKILVHGGGKLANQLAEKTGIESKMYQGRRITDQQTLEIVTMVYAGLINKNIVAQLQASKCNAIGLSGADANVICGTKRPVKDIDYGFAGDINPEDINALLLEQLIKLGLTPVFSAITHDGNGQLLNTNADTIASTIALALAQIFDIELVFGFEKKGVLKDVNDENSVIPTINRTFFEQLKTQHIIFEGMLPKVENALNATEKGVKAVIIGNSDEITDVVQGISGTRIIK